MSEADVATRSFEVEAQVDWQRQTSGASLTSLHPFSLPKDSKLASHHGRSHANLIMLGEAASSDILCDYCALTRSLSRKKILPIATSDQMFFCANS